jgi:hypothetical protein
LQSKARTRLEVAELIIEGKLKEAEAEQSNANNLQKKRKF